MFGGSWQQQQHQQGRPPYADSAAEQAGLLPQQSWATPQDAREIQEWFQRQVPEQQRSLDGYPQEHGHVNPGLDASHGGPPQFGMAGAAMMSSTLDAAFATDREHRPDSGSASQPGRFGQHHDPQGKPLAPSQSHARLVGAGVGHASLPSGASLAAWEQSAQANLHDGLGHTPSNIDLMWLPPHIPQDSTASASSTSQDGSVSGSSFGQMGPGLQRPQKPPALTFAGSSPSSVDRAGVQMTPPSRTSGPGNGEAFDGADVLTPQAAVRYSNVPSLQPSPMTAPYSAPAWAHELEMRPSQSQESIAAQPSPGNSEALSDGSRHSGAALNDAQSVQPHLAGRAPYRSYAGRPGQSGTAVSAYPSQATAEMVSILESSPSSSLSGVMSSPASRSNSQSARNMNSCSPAGSAQGPNYFQDASSLSTQRPAMMPQPQRLTRYPSSGSFGSSTVASNNSVASQGSDLSGSSQIHNPHAQIAHQHLSPEAYRNAQGQPSEQHVRFQMVGGGDARWTNSVSVSPAIDSQPWMNNVRASPRSTLGVTRDRSSSQSSGQWHPSKPTGAMSNEEVQMSSVDALINSNFSAFEICDKDPIAEQAMAGGGGFGPSMSNHSLSRSASSANTGTTTPTIMEEEEENAGALQREARSVGMMPQQNIALSLHGLQLAPDGERIKPTGMGGAVGTQDVPWSEMGTIDSTSGMFSASNFASGGVPFTSMPNAGVSMPAAAAMLPANAYVMQQAPLPGARDADMGPRVSSGSIVPTGRTDIAQVASLGDCSDFIGEYVRSFLATPSRLGLGERTVLIMTSKVAQKSYGSEKRFLCPPPMVMLIGSNWWSVFNHAESSFEVLQSPQVQGEPMPTVLTPPRVTVAISGETHMQDGSLEWSASDGRTIDPGNPSSQMAVSGRCTGKQLYITDFDDKRRSCEALVQITVPAESPSDRRLLGTFASKAIKIISKPSKKRQSSKNSELCVQHGSAISLFHRLRSQTVSTRYLCVSGAPTWFKGSDGQPFLHPTQDPQSQANTEAPSCFVARMSSWDPFLIYLVDPKRGADENAQQAPPPAPGYPSMPANALSMPESGSPPTIYYNQLVVLQCLHTGVVSPIMIIRKVDRGTTVLGGALSRTTASGETDGDPVSQLHKIAFEVWKEKATQTASSTDHAGADGSGQGDSQGPGPSGPFLACLNEAVGMKMPTESRRWVPGSFSAPPTPTTPLTPATSSLTEEAFKMGSPPMSPTSAAAFYAAAQTHQSLAQTRSMYTSPSSHRTSSNMDPAASSDGGKVKRPRRVSSSVVQQKERAATAAAKGRRRGQSLSMLGMQNQMHQQQQQQQHHHHHHHHHIQHPHMTAFTAPPGEERGTGSSMASLSNSESSAGGGAGSNALWTIEVGDSDTWTIVSTDIARYTFYIPPRLVGGVHPNRDAIDPSLQYLVSVPAPAQPIAPPPIVESVVSTASGAMPPPPPRTLAGGRRASGGGPNAPTAVVLHGQNFGADLFVFFGDVKSERVEVPSPAKLVCAPPPPPESGAPQRRPMPILLVRRDGVIFPTNHWYEG